MSRFFDVALLLIATAAVAFAGLSFFDSRSPNPTQTGGISAVDASDMVGSKLHPIRTIEDGGELGHLQLDGEPTLVLVFTATCAYCEAAAPRWRSLIRDLPERVRVIGITPEGLGSGAKWLERHELVVDDLRVPANVQELRDTWGVAYVPLTIVTDATGTVEDARYGELEDVEFNSIARSMALALQQSALLSTPLQ